ncbi:PREDICTED: uncharacterized protein LOC109178201 [Ipomoea nil]|uniref:uncharacterized protein LOC109178201 n=1 Tax=Ipomoea nil TaxID=35883 RepID=UPI000901321E|nr:PREDICTED: uncharacterized protein LOC109178201 [Ipomoea nil]
MDLMLWNCQGASGRAIHRALNLMLQVYKPTILGLFEPKVSGIQANKICSNLGFSDWVRVEAVGFSGGIWVLWKEPVHLDILFTHPQFILFQVRQSGKPPWMFAPVYGSPAHHLRRRLWRDLSQSKRGPQGPWMVAGDFNSVTSREETMNYVSFSAQRSSDFVNWIQDEGLIDMGFAGSRLTWVKDGSTDSLKGARLDRALCNFDWRGCFPDAMVEHLPRVASDHAPLLIRLQGRQRPNNVSPFLFQAAWTTHCDLPEVVSRTWNSDTSLADNIQRVTEGLTNWNKEEFGNVHIRKRNLLARLGGIQRATTRGAHRGLYRLEKRLQSQLEDTLYQEELLWFQQSRADWIRSGDRNTKFYHAVATVKKS